MIGVGGAGAVGLVLGAGEVGAGAGGGEDEEVGGCEPGQRSEQPVKNKLKAAAAASKVLRQSADVSMQCTVDLLSQFF